MKKLIALLLVLSMVLCLCACGGKEEPVPVEPAKTEEAPADPAVSLDPVTAELGDYTVTLLAAEVFEDIDDEPAIRFYYDFTNNGDALVYAWSELSFAVTQDGYELNETYDSSADDVPEYDNDMLNVIPGTTIRCIAEYSYNPDGGIIEVVVEEWYSEETMSMQFDPQNLQGRPEELEMPVISDPDWTAGMDTAGTLEEVFDVELVDYEFVEGYDDEKVLRVYANFTNNSEEATNMWIETYYLALQDGVELNFGSPYETVTEDDNTSLDIEPGETIACAFSFVVRSDSPIEVMITDSWGEACLGTVIPVA